MNIRKSPTVLVVEDDLENRKAMFRILQNEGYETLEADNGQDALDHVMGKKVDIMVTDLRLPVIDGVELLKRTKAAYPEVEVILITGYGTVEVAVEAIKEGAYDFITKPIKKGPAAASRREGRREAVPLPREQRITISAHPASVTKNDIRER